MANHASAQKRNRQNIVRNARNTALRSRVRGAIKEARAAIDSNADNKSALVQKAIDEVYKAASKNILKARSASRTVSRLMKASAAQ